MRVVLLVSRAMRQHQLDVRTALLVTTWMSALLAQQPSTPGTDGARGAAGTAEAAEPTPEPTPPEAVEADAATEPPPEPAPVSEPPPVSEPAPVEPAPSSTAEADAALMAAPLDAPPKPRSNAGPFAQGRIRVGGTIGFASAIGGSQSWFILGVGAGFFVLDGLEPHLDTTFWIGDPFLATLTPGLRYVFHMVPVVKPYVGTFYRHYFVSGVLGDTDSLGARLGVNFMLNEYSYLGGGVVYEHFLDDALFQDPDQLYPEILISIAF